VFHLSSLLDIEGWELKLSSAEKESPVISMHSPPTIQSYVSTEAQAK
jgi:hypothetical protein